ncbi:lysosome-associated membrane glycoprotein 2 isoform X2 [Antennarius striatus]|uniref:lysosome-associated membrane glycoprotein 2 isoform X2 n=1 Tax=Antennarius striatus TaxID=241820 RepID=UPI0035B42085
MYRLSTFMLFLALGTVFQQSHGIEVNVTDKDNKLCLYANLMVNFSVSYEVTGNKSATVKFELPLEAETSGSVCDTTTSTLKLDFGDGHSWSINFTRSGKIYQADTIVFSYNLNDTKLFPNSTSNETATVTVKPHIINVGVDTCYSCKSDDLIEADMVSQTLSNVLIQAFVSGGSKSDNLTTCAADVPTTTVVPTTTNATSTTTAIPTTNVTSTTPPTTSTPVPTIPAPSTGKYNVTASDNKTVCLLATFGLRIGLLQNNKYEEMNLDPNVTTAHGLCGVNISDLVLVSGPLTLMFTFTNDTKKFHLHALNITGNTGSGVAFSEANTNLSLWEAAISSSYMCNKEQNSTITDALTLFTFKLQVQPFGVEKGLFSIAHECSMDDVSILIPIIVGAALAGLIIIVVIAYVIGRRKTYVGYQTL